jgi:cytochrome-b5 reductase
MGVATVISPQHTASATAERLAGYALPTLSDGVHKGSLAAADAPPHEHVTWRAAAALQEICSAGIDSFQVTFRFEAGVEAPALLPGQHVRLHPLPGSTGSGVPVGQWRPFTPLLCSGGILTLMVRVYPAPAGDERGAFSRWLTNLAPGESVDISGPFGAVALDLHASSSAATLHLLHYRGASISVRRLVLVAGGSGVTPVAQILNAACAELTPGASPQSLEFHVLLSDHTPERALLVEELAALRSAHPSTFRLLHRTYTSTSPRIDEQMLRALLPPPSEDTVALCCGPAGFEASLMEHFQATGHVHSVSLSSGVVRSPAIPGAFALAAQRLAHSLRGCITA